MSNNKSSEKKETYNSNITKDDLQALGDKAGNLKTELSDDELLKNREKPVDFTGNGLDVPGRDLPTNTSGKLKDEENQLYSQGGGDNEDLEQTTEHIK
ncbi:MAG: hypothetical protein WA775_08355 [Psychroserpens sp.]|uniref:hypothetical protein n=1 Tax=Psychroserpens sp. TaxID=2020870 RepID=UPI003C734240